MMKKYNKIKKQVESQTGSELLLKIRDCHLYEMLSCVCWSKSQSYLESVTKKETFMSTSQLVNSEHKIVIACRRMKTKETKRKKESPIK